MKHFPDWRDRAAYPATDAYKESEKLAGDPLYTSKAWAWQFLRRNLNYQTDFNKFRQGGNRGLGESIAGKYGLAMMLPFSEVEPELVPFQNTHALRSLNRDIKAGQPLKLEDSQLALVFDIRLPVKEQLIFAKLQFLEEAERMGIPAIPDKRKRSGVLSRYLRIIDADRSGANKETIAEKLIHEKIYFPNEGNGFSCVSQVDHDLRVARKLVENGYLGIAYS
jgi:hypothetical protein